MVGIYAEDIEKYNAILKGGKMGERPMSDGLGGIIWMPSDSHEIGNAILRYEADTNRLVISVI